MVAQQVLLVAFAVLSVECTYPPNPILAGMNRRYGGGGGGYPTIKLPFPIPVKPGLLSKLEDVALDVLYDFRQLVKEEIRNSRTTTSTAMPPAALQQQIDNLQKQVDCNKQDQLDSPPIKTGDSSLLGLSFKDDCVQVAIGGQKIFRRCGQANRQRMFRELPDTPNGAFSGSSVNHDSSLFMKNPNKPFNGHSEFGLHPGKFPNNDTQLGAPLPIPIPDRPARRPDGLIPSRPGSDHPAVFRPSNSIPPPPSNQNHPSNHPPSHPPNHPPNYLPSFAPTQNMMPGPPGSKGWMPPAFNSKSWYGPPFDGKSWHMPPPTQHFGGSYWNVGTKSWSMPPTPSKSWYPQNFGQSWYQPPYGTKSWNMPQQNGQSWYQPPYGTKSWNMPQQNGKTWYPQNFGSKSWVMPPYGSKSWGFQQPLLEPHGFMSPGKGGYNRHFHFGGMQPAFPHPPPLPAGLPYDDPYYNKPFDFHRHPIQNSYSAAQYQNSALNHPELANPGSVDQAQPRRGKSINVNDELQDMSDETNTNGREINLQFPSSLKGTLSFPETDLQSILTKAANIPRKPGDYDPILVVAMPKEGMGAAPGEYDQPMFLPLDFPKYDTSGESQSSLGSLSEGSYSLPEGVLDRPVATFTSPIIRVQSSKK